MAKDKMGSDPRPRSVQVARTDQEETGDGKGVERVPAMAITPSEADFRRSAFPPIATYAFLSDREVNCLIAPSGTVEWLCLPRPDGPSVFAAMLDRAAGRFRLGPAEVMVPAGRRYLPGTLVLETTWQTRTGWLIVRDALVVGPWYSEDRLDWYQRAPTDYEAEHCLLRSVRCVNGKVDLLLDCEPVFEYGQTEAHWEYAGPGYTRAVARGGQDDPVLRLATNLRLGLEGRGAEGFSSLREGDSAFAAMSWADTPPLPENFEEAADRMWRTGNYWRDWLNLGQFPDHPWSVHLQRSALTLKGLTYIPTGALFAASTTSLPESPGGSRNWDYRYSWIRDATFALWGLYTLGFDWEANNFFYFIADAAGEDDDLQVMYGVGGERELEERALEQLNGYENARPVRVGNAAYRQEQHDVWGAMLDSVYIHTKSRDLLPERVWPLLKRSVESAIQHWKEPDRGIWEVRGPAKHFTSSKLMCWVACDRGARLARIHDDPDLVLRWRDAANEIKADICDHGLDSRGVFVQHYDTTALDASLLLMPLVRFLPPTDPRIRKTVLAIADELAEDGLILRYRVENTDDGLGEKEGTFTTCSFWMVSALAEIGEVVRARQLCEKLLSYASPLHLYAEEIDPRTGRHLGNFPQAFTHLALINAVMHIIRAEEREAMRFTPARSV